MKALLLTLGHNSSAVYYNGIDKPIGYEEERLSGVKGDSSFPRKAIAEIVKNGVSLKDCKIFISHWFDNFDLNQAREKYYDKYFIRDLCKEYGCTVQTLSEDFTHHDAHAYSSMAFIEDNYGNTKKSRHYVVADGFGNKQEVLSVYSQENGSDLKLVHRAYGYENSLGLMYQYATSFCGMKENQDEYKFLGYESQIRDHLTDKQITNLDNYIRSQASAMYSYLCVAMNPHNVADEHINLDMLGEVKKRWHSTFSNIMMLVEEDTGKKNLPKRVIIGYYIQGVIELTMASILDRFNIDTVVLSGGCFYNVKLNNTLLKYTSGSFSVMPLAGDQGAAIGMYRKYFGKFRFHDMCFGKRNLVNRIDLKTYKHKRIHFINGKKAFANEVVMLLRNNNIVNIMRGDMEFGPRALCNTSTLALPTRENVEYINALNERNTVMPMAPVLTRASADKFLADTEDMDCTIGSHMYMILAYDVNANMSADVNCAGVTHHYPKGHLHSARPQVAQEKDETLISILKEMPEEMLINTSFNTHGTPILFSADDAVRDFHKQLKHDAEGRTHLVILLS